VISAQAWLVMDAHTGGVIHGYRHNERRCIASMTKITTASVVLQLAVQNPWLLSSNVTVSREVCRFPNTMSFLLVGHAMMKALALFVKAATTIGTSANLHTGDSVTVQDLLYGLMLPSGNDAAVVHAL
jgi:serine-type D-Ala-D-Ala carboxypeptidase (penicillin-binding protein 5/6)